MQEQIYEPLITPQEAVKIAWHRLTVRQAEHAKEIMDAWLDFDPAARPRLRVTSELIMLLANLFEAGRVQGVREERQTKQNRPSIDSIAAGSREA